MPQINVKWRGKSVGKIEKQIDDTVISLKEEIASLTNVEVNNQKLMLKGKILKDSGISDGTSLMLMGTPSSLIPKNVTIEDIQRVEQEHAIENSVKAPVGLANLGNTCYLNATLQCLLMIPELQEILCDEAALKSENDLAQSIALLCKQLNTSKNESELPISLLSKLHKRFPHFAETNEMQMLSQQDAEECWSLLLNELFAAIPQCTELFQGTSITQMTCEESGETLEEKQDIWNKLNCHISTSTIDLNDGIESGLNEKIQKYSEKLGSNVEWTKKSKITHFPPYLAVNFIRFFWKAKEQCKAKILKKIKYPETLNLASVSGIEGDFPWDYKLVSVLTHVGRSADSGHYIAWIKDLKAKDDLWWKCDDDKISTVSIADVLKLNGGGDWPMAYLCVYRRCARQQENEANK